MAVPGDLRIFISYAHCDGRDLALLLEGSLAESGFDVWVDQQRIGGGAVWSTEIEREIDTCQVMLALLSPGSYASEICRAEQLVALDKGNRVIPVLAVKGTKRPLYLCARQYRDFTDDANYAVRLGELLADIRGDFTATLPDTYRETRVTYLTAPPRVANYFERPETLHALRDALFAEDQRQPIALTALAGMGGIGKTVLAKALTDDEVVRRAFPDGIVWITAGKERKRDFIQEMREVAKALGDDLTRYDNAIACEHQYRTTIANKAALIVVDDVWSKTDIEPLLAESPRSRFLFTTRDASIGRFVSASEHRADLLDFAQSRELLALCANLPVAELPATAAEVIVQCGRLPLALSVVGGMLRGSEPKFWTDTLDLLRKADLSAIQEQLPEGQDSFFKAVEVSFQSLKPKMQERYMALAVLLEDMAAPVPILEALWNVSDAEARRTSRHFVDRSLAQREGATESIRLHDLQLDYIRAQYPDKEALYLIHGAVRLSSNVIAKDPYQFASQMVGRLLPYQDISAITEFTKRVIDETQTSWLRPLHPALHPPGTTLIRTLEGHKGSVYSVAVTPDGQRVVSASDDAKLKVWDLESGRELYTLTSSAWELKAIAVTPDGWHAVAASDDGKVEVWDLEARLQLRSLAGHSDEVHGVALSRDGRTAVSASDDKTLKVWDLEVGREMLTLSGHTDSVRAVALMPDGHRSVSASRDSTLKVWDLDTGRELRTLAGHTSYVNAVALTPDGQIAVSASGDKTLKVWEVKSGRELRTLAGHSAAVRAVALTPDGQIAVSASGDKTLKVWEVKSGRELRTLAGHSAAVLAVALTPNGQCAVSGSADKTLKVWELESGREQRTLPAHTGLVRAVAVTPDGQQAVSASRDETLKVWDLASGRAQRTLAGHSGFVSGVALSGDGRIAVSASHDKTLKVWELRSGRELRTLTGHTREVTAVAVMEDGQRALSASRDNTLKVWDLARDCEPVTIAGLADDVMALAVTPDGQRAVSSGEPGIYRGELKIWDLKSGRELLTFEGHTGMVLGVALSGDGRIAVSASSDKTLKVWDVEKGSELRTLRGHSDRVWGVALSRDGRLVVSASSDSTVKVWDLETEVVVATFTCDSEAKCCAFSAPLKLIVAGDEGGHVHFLRLEEPKLKQLSRLVTER